MWATVHDLVWTFRSAAPIILGIACTGDRAHRGAGQVDRANLAVGYTRQCTGGAGSRGNRFRRSPEAVADAWSGPYRYTVAGPLVSDIYGNLGRNVVNGFVTICTVGNTE